MGLGDSLDKARAQAAKAEEVLRRSEADRAGARAAELQWVPRLVAEFAPEAHRLKLTVLDVIEWRWTSVLTNLGWRDQPTFKTHLGRGWYVVDRSDPLARSESGSWYHSLVLMEQGAIISGGHSGSAFSGGKFYKLPVSLRRGDVLGVEAGRSEPLPSREDAERACADVIVKAERGDILLPWWFTKFRR